MSELVKKLVKAKKRGRPRKRMNSVRGVVSFRMDNELYWRLKEESFRSGTSMSVIVGIAVEVLLDQRDKIRRSFTGIVDRKRTLEFRRASLRIEL